MENILKRLPFPVGELGWDKFDEVQNGLQLDWGQTHALMKMVCGDPPPGMDTRYIFHSILVHFFVS